jgi:hypothetical protein
MERLPENVRLRRFLWRAGRALYCYARGEVTNDIETNGEAYVQACVQQAHLSTSR